MKPIDGDARHRSRTGMPHRRTIGLTVVPNSADERVLRQVRRDPVAKAFAEAAVIEDFIDFLEDDGDVDAPVLPAADPLFRERLRRRIWRSMGFTLMRDVRELH